MRDTAMEQSEQAIRAAEFRDAESIFNLIKSYPDTLLPRAISDIDQNIDRFLVCDRGDGVLGCASWKILPEIGTPKNPAIEIQSLAVRKEVHSEGIGRALVKRAIQRVLQLHPSEIIVLTFTPEFFRKLGFVEVPKEKLMHKIYTGCVNCTKYDSPFTCPEVAMAMAVTEE